MTPLLGAHLSHAHQLLQSPHPQPPLLSGHCLPALITLGPGTRELATAPLAQKLFQIVNPESVHPACPVPSLETTVKAVGHVPPTLCLLIDAGASPCVPMLWYAPFSRDPGLKNCFFQSPDLLSLIAISE